MPVRTFNQNEKDGTFILRFPSTAIRTAYTPQSGELIYDCQQLALYIGDGGTAGGILVPSGTFSSIMPGIEFMVTGTLTAAAAATAVTLLADSLVPTGMKVYINGWFVSVGGGTAWTDITATIVTIQDSAAVAAVTLAKAGLTGNALLVPGSANTTLAAMITAQSGLTAGKGLQVVADHTFGAGSDLKVTVSGYIK